MQDFPAVGSMCPLSGDVFVCERAGAGAVFLPASSESLVPNCCLRWPLIVYIVQLETMQELLSEHSVALFACFCQVCFNMTSWQMPAWLNSFHECEKFHRAHVQMKKHFPR